MFVFWVLGMWLSFRPSTSICVSFPLSSDSWPVAWHTQAVSCSVTTLPQVCRGLIENLQTVSHYKVTSACLKFWRNNLTGDICCWQRHPQNTTLDNNFPLYLSDCKDHNKIIISSFRISTSFNLLHTHAFLWQAVSVWLHKKTKYSSHFTQQKRESRGKSGILQENKPQTAGLLTACMGV